MQSCFNSFPMQLAWLPLQRGSDLNLPAESHRTCYNLWTISVLTSNFCPGSPSAACSPVCCTPQTSTKRVFYSNRIKAGKMGVPTSLPIKAFLIAPDPTQAICLFNFEKKKGGWASVWQATAGCSEVLIQRMRMGITREDKGLWRWLTGPLCKSLERVGKCSRQCASVSPLAAAGPD